jgi:signal transduction histidine kinase
VLQISLSERPDRDKTIPAGSSQIFGSGEMADRIRAFDWSATPVGPIEQWEDVLLTTVNIMLSSRHPMFIFWGDELIQFYNDGYRATFDDTQHPLALGQPGQQFWSNIWDFIGPQIDSVMLRGESILLEDQFFADRRTAKHESTYWTYSFTPVRNTSGDIRGTLVVCTDTTDTVLARNLLNEENQRLADLFQQAPAFFAVLRGPEHVFEMANDPYRQLIGHRDLIGKSLEQALPEAHEQGFTTILDEVYRTGQPFVGRAIPVELLRKPGAAAEVRYLDFVYQPGRAADGSISSIIVLGVDVTEGRRAQQLLLRSEKLTAVGQLASTIAHEINNPLEAVTNLLYLARHSDDVSEIHTYLGTGEDELRRVAAITSQTLRFHRQLSRPSILKAEDLFTTSLAVYRRRIANASITVQQDTSAAKPVLCYEGEIRQALNNLIGNAIDAMPTGGTLTLRAAETTDWHTGRKGLGLTIADTGAGMSPETLKHIFDPFFTTKGMRGTGLGLWVTHEIVERHKGRLRVRSSESPATHGTTFRLFLPFDAVQR